MDFLTQLLFFVVLASFFMPVVQQKLLENARLRLLQKLERERGSRAIALIHRQESMALFGIPLLRYIDIDDSEVVLRAIRAAPPDKPIDLIIHTPGGLVLAATQIAYALKKRRAKTTVIIPHYAMSGGTLIALAADEILMDRNAVLGPVDPQISGMPAPSIIRAVERKGVEKVDDQTLIYADLSEKAINQLKRTVVKLLEGKMDREKAERLAEVLTSGRWTHDYPITFEEARELGLPVRDEVPPEVYALMELYPQPMSKRRSVEFALPR